MLLVGLVLVVGALQYQLWLGARGLTDMWQRQHRLAELKATAERLEQRNRRLRAEVTDLRREGEAIVERAREDLGMIRDDELFIRMVRPHGEDRSAPSGSGSSGPSSAGPAGNPVGSPGD
ncbi:MAG TPA: septum formation initiator family protein [Gammaproteobacteria bacterium]|nr:septum formation initiator family protein [Gammaproteobacteria bacterium]